MKKGGANFIEASRGPRIDHTRGEKRNNFVLSLRVRRRIWIMKSARQIVALRMRSYGTGRIFDRLKNLTVHFVHTEPFNIFVLFARNFIIVRLKCFRVNGTPKRTNPVSRIFFVRKWGGKSHGNRFAKRTNFQLVENSFSAVWTKHKRSLKHALLPQPLITGHKSLSFNWVIITANGVVFKKILIQTCPLSIIQVKKLTNFRDR